MAPGAKRKRGDRTFSQDSNDGGGRPSPHRPQEMNMAQASRHGGRGGSIGGNASGERGRRGGRSGGRGGVSSPTTPSAPQASASSPSVMGPPSGGISRPTTASNQPHQSLAQAQRPPTLSKPSAQSLPPFEYEYITEEHVRAWQVSGRTEIINQTKQALSDDDYLVSNVVFQELVRAGLDGRLDPTEAGQTVKEIVFGGSDVDSDSASSQFLDTLSIMMEGVEAIPQIVRPLVTATDIDPTKMRAQLEIPVLSALGLVRDSFKRMSIRKTTNELYRQCAFNLLREESEGYSKLMTEYFQTVNYLDKPCYVDVVNTFERVKATIGTFDLDTGRVLDVTLDVFASLLVKRFPFFVKFLRCSYWWPKRKAPGGHDIDTEGFEPLPAWAQLGSDSWSTSPEERNTLASSRHSRDARFWDRVRDVGISAFFEIGGRRNVRMDSPFTNGSGGMNGETVETTRSDAELEWIRATNTLPPSGNPIAAQLLGFKLRFYASNARDAQDVLPDNLIYLAALLIKIGFLSILDLYPHLYPPDDAMPALQEKLMKERAEREKKSRPGAGTMNALLMAAPLADDTLPPLGISRLREDARAASAKPDERASTPGKPDDDPKDTLPEPIDQKHKLLLSLLLMGAIPECLFILGRFPWLMDVYPDLQEHFHRLLHHCISKIYESSIPQQPPYDIQEPKRLAAEAGGLPKAQLALGDPPPRKILRWAQIEKMDSGADGIGYKFYYDDWSDNVPVCQSVDDIFTLCGSLLNVSGVKVGRDTKLMSKLARIGNRSLDDDPADDNKKRWLDLTKRLLVPALSLAGGNSGIIKDVYRLLQHYPTPVRYSVYAEWYTGPTSRLPDIKAAFDLSRAETRDVLKRISKENVKIQARALAKVANGSPGVVFSVTLNQIESYSNLIQVVIECAKYFTDLGYDVLTWSLLNSLGGKGRDAMQADGMLTSPWLRALSTFSGGVIKRYEAIDPTPLLQYICHQLRRGNSTDLEILEALLGVMTGIRADTDFNDSQMKAMQGGPLLRSRILDQVNDERAKPEIKLSATRLMRALVDNGLVSLLLMALTQERQVYIFRDDNKDVPLKVAASNLDKLHKVFLQYLDVLRTNIGIVEFDTLVPGVVELIKDFGLEPGLAFTISRSSITQAIADAEAEREAESEAGNSPTVDVRAEAADGDAEMGEATEQTGELPSSVKSASAEDWKMIDAPTGIEAQSTVTPSATHSSNAITEPRIIQELAEELRAVLPSSFEEYLNLSFYARFWQLSMVDLHFPVEQVQAETSLIKKQASETRSDRSDVSQAGVRKRAKRAADLEQLNEALWTEAKNYMNSLSAQKRALKREAQHWFKDVPAAGRKRVHSAVLQECFLPRIALSAADSHFCFRFLMHLHNSGTPGFHTVTLLDRTFSDSLLTSLLFQFTQFEAENFGHYISDVLQELGRWHKSKTEYERLSRGKDRNLPGFTKSLLPDGTPNVFLEFDEYRSLLWKWHGHIQKALITCLTGSEYMHIRNAIRVVDAIHRHFPAVEFQGKQLTAAVTDLSEKEEREDLKVMARSVLGHLKKVSKSWVLPQAFRPGPLGPNAHGTPSRNASEKSATPQPGSGGNSLNATAPDFKPSSQATRSKTAGDDSEDGEIDDARQFAKQAKKAAEDAANAVADDAKQSREASADTKIDQEAKGARDRQPTPTAPTSVDRPTSIPPRPDSNRSLPTQPAAASRVQHALPSRPDALRNMVGDRPRDARLPLPPQSFDDRRQPPTPDYNRSDRRGDFPYRDNRERSPQRGARGRTPERIGREPPYAPSRDSREHVDDRRAQPLARDSRTDGSRPGFNDLPPRDSRERYGPDGRLPPNDARGRLHGNPSMGPPASAPFYGSSRDAPLTDRAPRPLPNPPPRYEPPATVDQSGVNPARARLIEAEMRDTPKDAARREHEPRPHSPSRRDEHAPPSDFMPRRNDPREERGLPDRPGSSGYSSSMHDRRDDAVGMAPLGPRSDRGQRPDHPARELFNSHSTSTQQRPIDPNAGRLSRDDLPPPPRPQQEQGSGRLNTSQEIPSGPRGRNAPGRGGPRNFGGPGQPPSSPASDRPPSSHFNDRRDIQSSANQEPLGQRVSAPSTPITEQTPELSGIHPSRLQQLKATPTIQTDVAGPPSGPRGAQRNGGPLSAGLPSPSARGPPTGPADRDRSSRAEDKRFAGVNNILKESHTGERRDSSTAGAFERSNSGRGPRSNHRHTNSTLPSPATPTGLGPVQPPANSRDSVNNNNSNRLALADKNTQSQGDVRSSDNTRRSDRDRSDRDRDRRHRRSSKSPHRSSRDGSSRRDRPDESSSRADKRGTGTDHNSNSTPNSGRDRDRDREGSSRRTGTRDDSRGHRERSDRDREQDRDRSEREGPGRSGAGGNNTGTDNHSQSHAGLNANGNPTNSSSRGERRRGDSDRGPVGGDRPGTNAGASADTHVNSTATPHTPQSLHPPGGAASGSRSDNRRGQQHHSQQSHYGHGHGQQGASNLPPPPVPPPPPGAHHAHGPEHRNGELRIRGADRERERREGGGGDHRGGRDGGRKRGRGDDSASGGGMGGGGHADKRPRRSQG